MKRLSAVVLTIVLLAAAGVQASAWEWWAPTLPNTPPASSTPWQPNWPVNPSPNPNPNPNPSTPILPVQPSQPGSGSQVPAPSANLTSEEQRLIDQVNQERIKTGRQP
ncbi:MAG TPA: hypothetical protein DCQ17_00660, partial [Firmicutes bacterium]|nr:hypothetical protein [Bacillota bacterium]